MKKNGDFVQNFQESYRTVIRIFQNSLTNEISSMVVFCREY